MSFNTAGETRSAQMVAASSDAKPTFTYQYVGQSNEAEAASPLRVAMVDAAGNRTDREVGAEIGFDFTDPRITGGASLRLFPAAQNPLAQVTHANDTTELEISFSASELLPAAPLWPPRPTTSR